MASAPDMSAQMAQMNQPTAAETAQHKLGTAAQADYMRDIIGTERNPGVARINNDWVDYIGSDRNISFQKGQANGGLQLGFNGAKLLRSAAVGRTGGSGVGESGLGLGYSALGTSRAKSEAGVGNSAISEMNRSRLGVAKIGQGMNDAVISGYHNLGADQTQQNQTFLNNTIAGAERSLATTKGLMEQGGKALGAFSSAAAGSFGEDGNFDMSKFGSNMVNGMTGGLGGYSGRAK